MGGGCWDGAAAVGAADELQLAGGHPCRTPVSYFSIRQGMIEFPGCRGHRAYLSSAPHYDFPRYRQLVHEITLAFSGISREVLRIAGRLRDQLARPDLAQHLARLQEREQEKLQLTAQLQLARQQAQDQPEVDAHQQEVRELKHKLIKTIEAISEILQDLKYDSEEVE
ncbi:required for excision 1-B domain-containing protein isoform X1 [Rissa tridactyla]|uniref:required for excision 1-B domain-containing protein isoform X1 n=1 Tax=Rissa tridactyla TaxID=75485 RepID=UPI0023BB0F64|nr:required for excision 1-B domain-containing protein isoform X1 [Rissa tridactyla]